MPRPTRGHGRGFASMDGLLISGGADLHPERYGQPSRGSLTMEPDRDALEHEAWLAAQERGLPVLGVCRGLPGDQRILGRHAPPARRRSPGTALGERRGEDPSAPGRARHATRPDPLPDQRRRRGPARQLVPPPGRPGLRPGAGARRQRLGEQPGRRPDRGAGGGRRSFRVRGPVPSRAHRIDAAGLRAAVQRLRRRRAGAGRPALSAMADRAASPPSPMIRPSTRRISRTPISACWRSRRLAPDSRSGAGRISATRLHRRWSGGSPGRRVGDSCGSR